jgi:hypothetical protein
VSDQSTTWIAETAEAVEQASNVRQLENEIEFLADSGETLNVVLPELAALAKAAALGARTWWPRDVVPFDLLRDLQEVQQELGKRKVQGVVKHLDQFRLGAKARVIEAWQDHVDREVGRSDGLEDLAEALSGIAGLSAFAAELRQSLRPLAGLRRALPNAAGVDSLAAIAATVTRLETRLPEAVREFVAAAAHSGAALHELDAGVRTWLTENGAMDSFKIVVGRPDGRPA